MNRSHFAVPSLRLSFRPKQFLLCARLLRSLRSFAMTSFLLIAFHNLTYAATVTATPQNSSLLFRVKHDLGYTVGYFGDYTATVETGDAPDQMVSVKVQVATQSVQTRNGVRDEGLRSDLFLDAGKFPQAVFESTAVQGNEIQGTFTLKGVSHPLTLKAEKMPSGNLQIKGEFNRNDFGITYNKNLADKKKSIGDIIEVMMELKT